ncbi:ABC transporter ATP-binding protein [Parafrankia discariae]|uniref:ABC transporter ATP-binding protein n=1 Tax=Parafrankia discariae TaxID=365528 RepID=UPI00036AB002|nr:ABC transporter ATP-binding protein [Parafrankia discariae]
MSGLLQCTGLDAGYDGKPVVRDFSLTIGPGEVVALLGPNGAGKTTVMLTLAGLLPRLAGEVRIGGGDTPNGNPVALTRRGLVLVPDDRALFTTLTTLQNLSLGRRKDGPSLDEVLSYFPALHRCLDVRAGMLSGGEQQMLAMGRALMQRPKVLIIDELSMGLAPVIVQQLLPIVRRVATETGAAVLLVEQHVGLALGIADRATVLVHGTVALEAPAASLLADMSRIQRAYLGETPEFGRSATHGLSGGP